MLAWLRPDFTMTSSEIDETPLPGEAPLAYVKRMACQKAEKAANDAAESWVVLASDTIVELDGKILGKPEGEAEAWAMLHALRARTHHVYTAIAILQTGTDTMVLDCCIADVPMRAYSDDEITRYIASGDPFDKAGAYAIQNQEFNPVEQFSGCFACVMGFPLCHVSRQLNQIGLQNTPNPAPICLRELSYPCKISSSVLSFTDHITC